ncbi:MAG TPA: SRPBCC family protein [Gaiellaceae bacterium]|nr:SRPBCC family protein [Gaiellaceae bacterium]
MQRRVALEAGRVVPAPPEEVFAFLSDLRNHWRLEDRFVEFGGLEGSGPHGPTGGRVRIRGRLGLSRMARTRVLAAEVPGSGPGELSGRTDIGRRTVGLVAWRIERHPHGSLDTLSAHVESATLADRLLLALGGRRWLARIFASALDRLAVLMQRPG